MFLFWNYFHFLRYTTTIGIIIFVVVIQQADESGKKSSQIRVVGGRGGGHDLFRPQIRGRGQVPHENRV